MCWLDHDSPRIHSRRSSTSTDYSLTHRTIYRCWITCTSLFIIYLTISTGLSYRYMTVSWFSTQYWFASMTWTSSASITICSRTCVHYFFTITTSWTHTRRCCANFWIWILKKLIITLTGSVIVNLILCTIVGYNSMIKSIISTYKWLSFTDTILVVCIFFGSIIIVVTTFSWCVCSVVVRFSTLHRFTSKFSTCLTTVSIYSHISQYQSLSFHTSGLRTSIRKTLLDYLYLRALTSTSIRLNNVILGVNIIVITSRSDSFWCLTRVFTYTGTLTTRDLTTIGIISYSLHYFSLRCWTYSIIYCSTIESFTCF